MSRNIVEKAMVPHNPSTNTVINHERYNLFVPVARQGRPGIASFSTEDFNIANGKVTIKNMPLVVGEFLHINAPKDQIIKGYSALMGVVSLNKVPKKGERFWCLIKSADNCLITAIAEMTKSNEFTLMETCVVHDPAEALHLKSETEQVVDSDVKVKGNLTVTGEQVVDGYVNFKKGVTLQANLNTESLTVNHRYIVCNYSGVNGVSSGLVMLTGEYDESDLVFRYQSAYGIIYDAKDKVLRHGRGYVKTNHELDVEDDVPWFYFGYVETQDGVPILHEEEGKIVGKYKDSLLLDTEEKQTVQGNVEFKKDINIFGNLTVSGTQTVLNTESLTVDHRYIVCNYNGVAGVQTGFAMLTGNRDMISDGQRDFYPAYGIIYDPESNSVRLGRGYVTISDELDYEDYTPLFHFGYVERDDFGVQEHEESGQAIATRSNSDDIPDGNLVKWDATQNKLVDTGYRPAVGASGNTVVIRNASGIVFGNESIGTRNALTTLVGVQKALSFRSVDSYTSNTLTYAYKDVDFIAKGWLGNGTFSGEIYNLPHTLPKDDRKYQKDWAQRIINATDSEKTLTLKGALKLDNSILNASKYVFFCTDKATLNSANTVNGDLSIFVKPHSSIYINSVYSEANPIRIYIT